MQQLIDYGFQHIGEWCSAESKVHRKSMSSIIQEKYLQSKRRILNDPQTKSLLNS